MIKQCNYYTHTYNIYPCMSMYMHTYVVEVNMNIAGMNAFLFPMEFLHFGEKIPSLLHF